MAVSYKGLTIKFGGDTTDLQKKLGEVQKNVRNTQADLKAVQQSLKFNPGNTELLAQKVRNLNKAYEETKTKLEAYKSGLAALEEKKEKEGQLTEDEQRQYDALQRDILRCENQLESYAKQLESTSTELEASKTKLYQFGQTLEDNAETLKKHGERMETAGKAMIGTSTAITGASIAAFKEVDAGYDAVVKATGATGEAAKELEGNVRNVATTVAGSRYSWEELGSAVGEVNTRFGFTGQDLDDCSERFMQFASITGTDAVTAVQLVSRAMGDAGIEADDYGEVLDSLALAAQASGISVDKLAGLLTSYGAPMRALGFDTQSAIAIFSQWELAGVNTETAFSGMKKAISNWSKEGKDAKVEFGKTLDEIAKCPDIASATTKAIEVFGAKAGPDLADAIQGGRFEYQQFMDILEGSQGTVEDTFNETADGIDNLNVAQKELQAAGADLGEAFSDVLGPMISDFAGMVHDVAEAFSALSPEQKEFVAKAVLMTGAAGGLTLGLGKIFQSAGQIGGGLKSAAGIFVDVKGKFATIGEITTKFGGFGTKIGEVGGMLSGKLAGGWSSFTGLIAAHPIALGVAAVAAAVAGLTWFFTQTETGKKMWSDFTGWISEKWQGVQDFFAGVPEFWSGVWGKVTGKASEVKKGLSDTWDGLKKDAGVLSDTVGREWEQMKTDAQQAFDAIKSRISDKMDAARSAVITAADRIGEKLGFSGLGSKVAGVFDNIKSSISGKMGSAKEAVRNAIDRIKGFFNFSWSLPRLKMPHPYISGSFSLNPPRVPHFGISWYAKGGAIEPNNPHLIGVGDSHEREWIEPESKLLDLIESAMRNVSGNPSSLSVEVNVNATVTGRQSAYELGQNIGRGISSTMKQRGYSHAT